MEYMSDALNKTKRRHQERRKREKEKKKNEVIRLEPLFPFTIIEFDLDFLDVPANPPDKIAISEN